MSFKAWAQKKIPVAHRVIKTVHESKTMRIRDVKELMLGDPIIPSSNPLGELLPNGFRVGERVFYTTAIGRDYSYRNTGTIVRNPHSIEGVPAENAVWANWDNGSTPGWMPTNNVFRV